MKINLQNVKKNVGIYLTIVVAFATVSIGGTAVYNNNANNSINKKVGTDTTPTEVFAVVDNTTPTTPAVVSTPVVDTKSDTTASASTDTPVVSTPITTPKETTVVSVPVVTTTNTTTVVPTTTTAVSETTPDITGIIDNNEPTNVNYFRPVQNIQAQTIIGTISNIGIVSSITNGIVKITITNSTGKDINSCNLAIILYNANGDPLNGSYSVNNDKNFLTAWFSGTTLSTSKILYNGESSTIDFNSTNKNVVNCKIAINIVLCDKMAYSYIASGADLINWMLSNKKYS